MNRNIRSIPASEPYQVAIIGAGASGTLVAAQLRKLAPYFGRVAQVGGPARPGRGLAYGTHNRLHLLNVRAGNMSAFPDDLDHFVRWLKRHLPEAGAGTFAPRTLYGDYLGEILDETLNFWREIDYFRQTAAGVTREKNLWKVHLDDGRALEAQSVVLALGNLLLPDDPIDFGAAASGYFRNPWSPYITRHLAPDAPVFLLGSGLTMMDVVLSLQDAGHRGLIHTLSRHGRRYQTHAPHGTRPLNEIPVAFGSPHTAIRWVRSEIRKAQKEGEHWQSVIDSLRPHTAAIWGKWSTKQRASFLRHARNLWDIHRHRVAPEIAARLEILIDAGALHIHRGHLVSAEADIQGVRVEWREAGTGQMQTLNAARLINCTGPSRDYSRADSALVAGLRDAGWLRSDKLHLGLETDPDGRLIGANGNGTPGLYTLGPPRIAGQWESIAIPEIRVQAEALARLLINEHAAVQYKLHEQA